MPIFARYKPISRILLSLLSNNTIFKFNRLKNGFIGLKYFFKKIPVCCFKFQLKALPLLCLK